MKSLTKKEEEIMNHFWNHGPMHIRELRTLYTDPKPHVNTLSTLVRILEDKGFISHEAVTGKSFRYFAKLSRDDYGKKTINQVVNKLLGKSYLGVVSSFVNEEKITIDELKELIKKVEDGQKMS